MPFDPGVIWHSVESVLTFLVIGIIGYFLAKRGWFSKETLEVLSRLVIRVALPIYLLYNFNNTLTREELPRLLYGLSIPLLSIFLSIGAGLLFSRLFRVSPSRRGVVSVAFAFSNSVYIGLPINIALFGEESVPYALTYFFANAILFWTAGNYLMSTENPEEKARIFTLDSLKRIISPPIIGLCIGVALLALNIKLPVFIANAAKAMGGLTTPLVVISLGATIQAMGFAKMRFSRDILLVFFGRFMVAPLIIILLTLVFPMPDLMRKVYIIQASLPIMSNVAALAAYNKSAELEFTTLAISMTTLAALVTIPLFMVIVSIMA